MYPFYSRISSVQSAPHRLRFRLTTGTISEINGGIKALHSSFTSGSKHLCYFIRYKSYTAMMQQT